MSTDLERHQRLGELARKAFYAATTGGDVRYVNLLCSDCHVALGPVYLVGSALPDYYCARCGLKLAVTDADGR